MFYQFISHLCIKTLKRYPSERKYNLTISDSKRFIWYRIAKNASRTIFNIFEQADIKLAATNTYACYYPTSNYIGYTKFAFARNPWDRLVSCWLDKVLQYNIYNFSEEEWEKMKDLKNFVHYVKGIDVMTCKDSHLRMQATLIDLNQVNFIGRFENFETDLQKLLNQLSIEGITVLAKKKSKNRNEFHQYYNQETRLLVAEIYSLDIQIFNYKFS